MNSNYKIHQIECVQSPHFTKNYLETKKRINRDLKLLLTNAKSEINNNKQWDVSKKRINEYELISMYINQKISPISRSYYKLIEILTDFNLDVFFHQRSNVKCACICEGPGGFVQALNHYMRKKNIQFDTIPCISLISSDRRIPKWKVESENLSYRLCYGEDKTGDLYKKNNIHHFVNDVGKFSCDFVTADGGFDFSSNFNSQEVLFQRLLFSEIYTILKIQKNGGKCVIKVFDLFDDITISLITLLVTCYRDVYIHKPFSSRPANSEKYLICMDYNANEDILTSLEELFSKDLSMIHQICDPELNNLTIQSISDYNKTFVKNQIHYINRTIEHTMYDVSRNSNVTVSDNLNAGLCIEWVNKYMRS